MRLRGRLVTGFGAALSAVLLAAGCTGGGDTGGPSPTRSVPTTSPTSPSPPATPSDAANLPEPVARRAWQVNTGARQLNGPRTYLVASVYGLYRSEGHLVVLLGLELAGDLPASGGEVVQKLLSAPTGATPQGASDGLALVDPAAKKAYLVARTAQGGCVCSVTPQLAVGRTTLVAAMFADPPAQTRRLDVAIPHFGVVPDVPISDSAPPSPSPGPMLLTARLQASPPPSTAPVVDLVTPVANLDLSVTEENGKLILAADVLFAFDKANLTGKARSRIAEAAQILRRKARGTIRVNGYTDSMGSGSYNLRLSKRRAGAVRDALRKRLRGSGLKLTTHGYGEKDPVAPNTVNGKDNPKGRKLNRRVEILYHRQPGGGSTPVPTADAPPPVAQPSGVPTPGRPLASRKKTFFGQPVTVQVYGLHRDGDLVTLALGFRNRDNQAFGVRERLSRTGLNDVTGVRLVDRKAGKAYLPARFPLQRSAAGECLCSYGYFFAMPGQTQYLYATYAAPPRSTARLDVHVPHVGTFKGIPIG